MSKKREMNFRTSREYSLNQVAQAILHGTCEPRAEREGGSHAVWSRRLTRRQDTGRTSQRGTFVEKRKSKIKGVIRTGLST